MKPNRRRFVQSTALVSTATCIRGLSGAAAATVLEPKVELPRGRVPLSFIIDDSTCLVNMGKFCMPQFAATYPEREGYQKPWQQWPAEIPDSFVREFGQWCAEHGVKGKYSIVPYPACVGWLDRTLPGWSQRQLRESLKLVQDLMVPNWDIHPEMITHTRVIDLKTGRPFEDNSPAHMENSYPQEDVSVDYLASYLAYALRILKNCDLPCEGITTPGGFGNRVKDKLPLAVLQAVRDVYGTDLPHYFKYVVDGKTEDTFPKLEAKRKLAGDKPDLVMNVPAGTGDWFGGWDGVLESAPDKYCDEHAESGRMVELIESGQPAVMLCHWPGMYCNGTKAGFRAFQRVVESLHAKFAEKTLWMKVSEIGRYWAAKALTEISLNGNRLSLRAPYSCKDFTLSVSSKHGSAVWAAGKDSGELELVKQRQMLKAGSYTVDGERTYLCLDLAEGETVIELN